MFSERRERFMQRMGGGVAVFFAAPERVRSNDTQHPFRQDSYFHYLTGFGEPEAAAVLLPGHPEHRFLLFVRPRDPERETWNGRRAGPEGAKERFGADAAYPITELAEHLPGLLENQETLYYGLGRQPERDAQVLDGISRLRAKVRQGVRWPTTVIDPASILDEMRLFKTPAELDLMREAAAISRDAHIAAMRAVRPGIQEYEVQALIEYEFRRRGASGPAYGTIVGSGVNATILHYTENESRCEAGDLLLIDAGAEFGTYSADITRTFPVSGTFTPPQREVYEIVLAAQLAAIERTRPGATFEEVHEAALRTLVEGLLRLGILSGTVEEVIEKEAYKPYYMHRTSHWLGLDVHDVGRYREGEASRKLEPGMVLTVEPGLYFPVDSDAPEAYRGMGVRIEDDVLVTSGLPEVLTEGTPKAVEEVERTMAEDPGEPVPLA